MKNSSFIFPPENRFGDGQVAMRCCKNILDKLCESQMKKQSKNMMIRRKMKEGYFDDVSGGKTEKRRKKTAGDEDMIRERNLFIMKKRDHNR